MTTSNPVKKITEYFVAILKSMNKSFVKEAIEECDTSDEWDTSDECSKVFNRKRGRIWLYRYYWLNLR